MVKVSTLFVRVDDFENSDDSNHLPDLLDQTLEDRFLEQLLKPLVYDPGEELVLRVLQKI